MNISIKRTLHTQNIYCIIYIKSVKIGFDIRVQATLFLSGQFYEKVIVTDSDLVPGYTVKMNLDDANSIKMRVIRNG